MDTIKICIPTEDSKGLDSIPYAHFGSAPYFIIYNTASGTIKTINNQEHSHQHGACNPIHALGGEGVNAIIVGGIGRRALGFVHEMGIRAYQSVNGTVKDNIVHLKNGDLVELTQDNTCMHHTHGCGSSLSP